MTGMQTSWRVFYSKMFGVDSDILRTGNIKSMACYSRLIVDLGTDVIRLGRILEECIKTFAVYCCWEDIDSDIIDDPASPVYPVAVWIRDRVEADEELSGISAEMLERTAIKSISLRHRMLYELKYYSETGCHLDNDNITLCAGSRDREGNVPWVNWYRMRLQFGKCGSWYSHDRLRSRAVVL